MSDTPTPMKIDFVSDVVCPWCAIGLKSLERAIERLEGEIEAHIHVQPFELHPDLGAEGDNATEHLMAKYGIDRATVERNREAIRQRGQDVGFDFATSHESRVYNTFDAHRLLHWAGEHSERDQLALKHALLRAYFTLGLDVSDHEVLQRLASEVGLDGVEAMEVLREGRYADSVREREHFYANENVRSVPSVIINDVHLIQGGQPPEVFERALRELARRERTGDTTRSATGN
ncbi:DsbA family oxidoreductase [Oleiagrimonas sp. C23AA]|uniref:DsbA family oxidoreductase n=1 Tax=Oleiagrimonas sp. C23AA TaxID=2719047 RepID=UPI0014245BBD|nr:DsbA family oxidoreductase [Oleiagrimonas sp. C23AA]NII12171.1 DsbA family oxidoreductase [Oleiagrimonas sp. C23AA]